MPSFRILFFGDIVGSLGRTALIKALPELKTKHRPDIIIANVENLAHGAGVTQKTLQELVQAGVDAFTGGNHSWGNPLGVPLFEDPEWKNRMIVPTNYGGAKNGNNSVLIIKDGVRVVVGNLMGQLFTHSETSSPFTALDALLAKHETNQPHAILIDLHAEATAEKEALGHYADGKVSAVVGTHTHVATADAKILPGGTAYVTDVGRCGCHDSVIGFEKTSAIKRFLGESQQNYGLPTSGVAEINGILIEVDINTKKAIHLDRIRKMIDV